MHCFVASGITIHVGRAATGLAFIGRMLSPAFTAGGTFWERLAAIPIAMGNDVTYQRDLAVAGGAYIALRAIGPSVEKSPLLALGKVRIYAL
jgi:hypothetical protein